MSYENQNRNRDNRPVSYGNGFDLQSGLDAIDGWISHGIDSKAIAFTEKLGVYLAENRVTTSQIRNIYGEVMRINLTMTEHNYSSVLMLKPKLAYAQVRSKSKIFNNLSKFISTGIDSVDMGKDLKEKKKRFSILTQIFEAIVAYHKAKSDGDK